MKFSLFWLVSLALLVLAVGSSVWIFQTQWHLPITHLFYAHQQLPIDALVFQNNILPRLVMAILVGGALSVATIVLQHILRNPLASDSTLAVSGGAQTALVLATVFFPNVLAYGNGWVALLGAALALLGVMWLSAKHQFQPLTVVLAGLVMSLYLGAMTGVVTLFYAEETRGMLVWASGSLIQDSWHDTQQLLWQLGVILVGLLLLIKPLAVLSLSDQHAQSLGLSVKKIRLLGLLLVAVLCASVVDKVGMMGFIGLASATIVRQLGMRTLPQRLLAGFGLGGLLLLITDNLLILLAFYSQWVLPTGTVTALIGAPLLLWLMMNATHRVALPQSSERVAIRNYSGCLNYLPACVVAVVALAILVGNQETGWQISWQTDILALRYPRVLLAMAMGMALAIVGVLLQRLTQNPMASPELLGISSGAALGAMLSVLLFNVVAGSWTFWLVGLLSALGTLLLILWFNHKNGLLPEKVLLTGMAMASLSDSVMRISLASGDFRLQQLLVWLSGSTYQTSGALAVGCLVGVVGLLLLCLPLHKWLSLLSLGGMVAQSVGVPVRWARWVLILLCAILTALATLLIGPLSFVGLLAPHLANTLGARLPRQQLISAALLGGGVMVLADFLGRQWLFPYEIPAGLMATLLGGGYFLLVMRRL